MNDAARTDTWNMTDPAEIAAVAPAFGMDAAQFDALVAAVAEIDLDRVDYITAATRLIDAGLTWANTSTVGLAEDYITARAAA